MRSERWTRARAALSAARLLTVCSLATCLTCVVGGGPLKQRLVGIDARELRKCVGIPTSVDLSGEDEVLVFRFGTPAGTLLDAPRNPRGPDATLSGPLGRRSGGQGGFCELTFALRDGRVQEVEVRGRRANGLNDNAACLRRAGSCVTPID